MPLRDRACGMSVQNGLVSISFTFDDVTGLIVSATLTNSSSRDVLLTFDAPDGTRLANGITVAAGGTRTALVPAIRRWLLDSDTPRFLNLSEL